MKKIIINDNNLDKTDIEKNIVRVKALIINSSGKILIAHNNYTYQFPGGHVEDNEDTIECLKREIKEETGIEVEEIDEPFLSIITYDNNYFGTGDKVLNTIYYYRIITDEEPDLSKTQYDELELKTDFKLFYVKLDNLENFIDKNMNLGNIDKKIGIEMKYVISEYNKIYGG